MWQTFLICCFSLSFSFSLFSPLPDLIFDSSPTLILEINGPDCYLNSDIFSDTWHFGANGNGTLSGDDLQEEDKFLNPHPVLQSGATASALPPTSNSFSSPSSSSSAVSSHSPNSSNGSPGSALPALAATDAMSGSSNNGQTAARVKVKLEPFFADHSEFNLVGTLGDDIDIDGDLSGNGGLLVDSGNCSLTSFSTSPQEVTTSSTSGQGGNALTINGASPSTALNQSGATALSLCPSSFLSDHLK